MLEQQASGFQNQPQEQKALPNWLQNILILKSTASLIRKHFYIETIKSKNSRTSEKTFHRLDTQYGLNMEDNTAWPQYGR